MKATSKVVRPITEQEAADEVRDLERKYGKRFLRKSLHEVGIRWRLLTSPDTAERIRLGQIGTFALREHEPKR